MGALRIAFCLLAMFFAWFFGRTAVWVRRQDLPKSKMVPWALRTIVVVVAVFWGRGLDAVSIAAVLLAALSFAGGAYTALRPPRHEELEKVIFPKDRP